LLGKYASWAGNEGGSASTNDADPAAKLQPLVPHRSLGAIDAVYLKDRLGPIHAHTSKLLWELHAL
jgi:hypothetical protein